MNVSKSTNYHIIVIQFLIGTYFALHWFYSLNLINDFFDGSFSINSIPSFLDSLEVYFISILLSVLSILYALNFYTSALSLFIMAGYACQAYLNPFTIDLQFGFLIWLMILCYFMKNDSIDEKNIKFYYSCAWLTLGICYSVSGIHKLQHSSWLEGTAITKMLLINSSIPKSFLLKHLASFKFLTWTIVFTEAMFLPATFFKKTRFFAFFIMTVMHLGIMLSTILWPLSLGVLIFHYFFIGDFLGNKIYQKLSKN